MFKNKNVLVVKWTSTNFNQRNYKKKLTVDTYMSFTGYMEMLQSK